MLYVSDNGVGIPRRRLNVRSSLGLLGMSERARKLGGTLRITSCAGHGTRVLLTLPLERDSGLGIRDSKTPDESRTADPGSRIPNPAVRKS